MDKHWGYLLGAVAAEVAGTCAVPALRGHSLLLGYGLMYGLIGVSYYLLSVAVLSLPLALALAAWEGLGTLLVTAVSVLFLGEAFSLQKGIGLTAVILGAVLIKKGMGAHAGEAVGG